MIGARIELICVGSELLDGQLNTHQSHIGLRLRSLGLQLWQAATLPDDPATISRAIMQSVKRSDALLLVGGLGPTFDDVTREAAASALGRGLSYEPSLYATIRKRFARYKAPVPRQNKRQAFVIEGAIVLDNPYGSAPGQLIKLKRRGDRPCAVALLPGPFSELSPMLERHVIPRLRRWYAAGLHQRHVCVRLAGLSESTVDERLSTLTKTPGPGMRYTILAGGGQVDFHVFASGACASQASRRLEEARQAVYEAAGEHVFGEDDATLESALGEALLKRRLTLATAESCTGGWIGKRLTSVAGSSRYYLGGVIAYDNAVKTRLLGVAEDTLALHGAVSQAAAEEMAEGARRATGADMGLAVTGIAGPGGGTPQKPVGLVIIAVAGPGPSRGRRWQLNLLGQRQTVRERAAGAALWLALAHLKSAAPIRKGR